MSFCGTHINLPTLQMRHLSLRKVKLLKQVQTVTKWLGWDGTSLVFGSEAYAKVSLYNYTIHLPPDCPFPFSGHAQAC